MKKCCLFSVSKQSDWCTQKTTKYISKVALKLAWKRNECEKPVTPLKPFHGLFCTSPTGLFGHRASVVWSVCVCLCLIWTHPARWDGQDGTSWQPGQPGTRTRRHPSARRAGSANDALLSRGRQSRCSEGSLQRANRLGSVLVTFRINTAVFFFFWNAQIWMS